MGIRKIRKPPVPLTLRQFHERRNRVLIYRSLGGLGDILMHRMMFADFKKQNPEIELVFACPVQYHEALKDHPYLDKVLDHASIDFADYNIVYNTSSACTRYELGVAPLSGKHRSDIWANHCGIEIEDHSIHLTLLEEELNYGQRWLKQIKNCDGPSVMLCPVSAMVSKNLLPEQLTGVVKELRKMGCFVYSSHTMPIPEFEELQVPVLYGQRIRQWMSLIMAADYVVSVDTAAFHFAGSMGKRLTGIFTWADGKVYGKYYKFELVQKHRDCGNWPCGPCYEWTKCPFTKKSVKPCLTEITVEMIMEGVRKMMEKGPR